MLTSITVSPINHVLRRESWACRRLQSHSGKTICIRILPLFELNIIIQANGELQETPKHNEMDATLTLSPIILAGLLAHDEQSFTHIESSGDIDLAAELINIGKNIHFNAEQDLSKIVGDIPAHRIAQVGEQVIQWHAKSINNLSEALAEYWLEEQPMIAKSAYISEFTNQVGKLQNDLDRLDQRIRHLKQKAAL